MAYQILCDGHILDDPRDEELFVLNPKCNLEVNKVGEGSFTILPTHPHYDKLVKLKSVIEIRQDGEVIFRGRMTNDSRDFYNQVYVDLEGVLGYANDTLIPPFEYPFSYVESINPENTVEYFLSWILDEHNYRAEDWQRLELGRVTVRDPNNYISRASESFMTTWEVLKTKLFDSALGGYLVIRYEEDGNYVDYLETLEETNGQAINFGENLLDIINESDASETYSAILPIGKDGLTFKQFGVEELTEDFERSGWYIYSKSQREAIGWVCVPPTESVWEDVTDLDNLAAKAMEYLKGKAMLVSNTITIKAADLRFSNDQIQSFRIARNVMVNSPVHGVVDAVYPLTRLELDIHNPQNTVITIGDTRLSLTDINAGFRQNADSKNETLKAEFKASMDAAMSEQETVILQKCDELYNTKIEQLYDSITLELSGSLGDKAEIKLSLNGNEYTDQIELDNVREAFANDNTAVTISAGVITFNSGTIVINSNNFSLDASGHITANGATINGKVTTVSSSFMTELDRGSLRLYYDEILCGTINTKYWSGAATEGISLRVEEGGNYIMFSHADSTQGSGYTVDYYLNAGWSSNYDEMHIFQTSARFLSDAYFAGKTRIRSLRLFDADGEYLVGINNGALTVSKL